MGGSRMFRDSLYGQANRVYAPTVCTSGSSSVYKARGGLLTMKRRAKTFTWKNEQMY